jgi:hypothetical protein
MEGVSTYPDRACPCAGVGISSIAMDPRAERVAKNEASHRELNEAIEVSYESRPEDAYMDVVCECGQGDCAVFLKVTRDEYEGVRADSRHFLILRDHRNAEIDVLVSDFDRFMVVAEREGEPAQVSEQTDPRS